MTPGQAAARVVSGRERHVCRAPRTGISGHHHECGSKLDPEARRRAVAPCACVSRGRPRVTGRRAGRRLGLVAGAVAIALAVLAVLFALDSYRAARRQAATELRAAAAQAAADTRAYTANRLQALAALARQLPAAAGDPRTVEERLASLASNQPGFDGGLLWVDRSGAVHTSKPGRRGLGEAEAVVARVQATGRSVVSPAIAVPALGGEAIVFAVPTRLKDGRRTGILAAGVTIPFLSSSAAGYRLPEASRLWITDATGDLIAGPGVRRTRSATAVPAYRRAASAGGRAGVKAGERGFDGRTGVVAWASEERSGWTLFVEQRESAAFGSAAATLRKQLLGIAIVLLLGAATIGVLARRFDRLAAGQEAARASAERRLRRARALGELSASLAGAVAVPDVRQVVLGWALDEFRGDLAALVESDEDGVRLHRASSPAAAPETVRLHRDDRAVDVLATRAPVWPERSRELEPALRALEVQRPRATSGLAVPLSFAGETVAVVLAVSRETHRFDDEDREHWSSFAAQAAQALERARLNQREREIATEFQSRLLPSSVAGERTDVTVSAAYLPAESELALGGDWYDAIPLADGRMVLAVGDVIGHGVQAAVVMGQLRTAIMTLAPICDGPAELLERLDAFTDQIDGGEFSTVQCAYVDLATGIMRSASAGHPPMVVIDAAGRPAYVWEGRSAPLCVSDGRKPEDARLLEGASTLLLFTDGLYERRDATVDEGLHQLLEVCAGTATAGPGDLAEAVVHGMLAGGTVEDDVAVLALTLSEQLAPALVLSVPPRPEELAGVRASVHDWLFAHVVDESRRHQIVLAVHEAVANAVEHGGSGDVPAMVVVELSLRPGAVDVVVRDNGRWQERDPFHLEWEDERGRGLSIIDRLATEASIDRGRGTVVRMRFDLVPDPSSSELAPAAWA